ncbi:MAG: PD-(D/E)XK nuclease domain-containing protein [Parabacteroides sp.]|nr:PD-(D/E)XK nuclease domain-containing protein [Parabacteroides sp.]
MTIDGYGNKATETATCGHTDFFCLLAQYENIDVEMRTPTGRVDMVMRTDKALYLFELKMNKSAAAAMKQIDLKDNPARFAQCGLPIVKVGINFDDERRTIGDWEIVPTR